MMEQPEKGYRRFLFAVILITFSALFMIYSFNYVVDPYNFNRKFNLGLAKEVISYKANYQLYKISEYINKPCPNIMLGDSRANAFTNEFIEELTGKCFYNFSYPGGTMSEALDTFNYVSAKYPLREVYINFGFDFFLSREKRGAVGDALYLTDHPTAYYLSSFTSKISARNVVNTVRGNTERANTPPDMTKEAFWAFSLKNKGETYYRRAAYPEKTVEELRRMKAICNNKGIKLIFIIGPSHDDFQMLVPKYGLEQLYARFKHDLASISTTVDFDYKNDLTNNMNNFGDPVHFTPETMQIVAREVWGEKYIIGRKSGGR